MRGHLRQRGDVWELRASAGRDPISGRKLYRTNSFRGGKRAAEDALSRFVLEVSGAGPSARDATVGDLVAEWFELAKADPSPSTVRGYEVSIRRYITSALGDVPLDQLRPAQLDRLYARLRAGEHPAQRPLATATIRLTHAILRRALQQGVKWGWISSNPAVLSTPPRVRNPTIEAPLPEAVGQLIIQAASENADLGAFLQLAATTPGGLRKRTRGSRRHRAVVRTWTVGPTVEIRSGVPASAEVATLIRATSNWTRHRRDLYWRLAFHEAGSQDVATFYRNGEIGAISAWQQPWASLDTLVKHDVDSHELFDAVIEWARSRFEFHDAERGSPLPYWIECADWDTALRTDLVSRGFGEFQERYDFMTLELTPLVTEDEGGLSILIRSLRHDEVEEYSELHRLAFASNSVTTAWRQRTFEAPTHDSEFDLVAVTEEGALIGFCVGWCDPERDSIQIEPLGVHPDWHGRGIGGALLRTLIQLAREAEVRTACVEVGLENRTARSAYEKLGFNHSHQVNAFGMQLGPT